MKGEKDEYMTKLGNKIRDKTDKLKYCKNITEIKSLENEIIFLKERATVTQWLSGFNIKYHITITFNCDINEYQSEDHANHLLTLLRNEYHNKRSSKYFDGIVVKEFKKSNSVHYHILLFDNFAFYSKKNKNKSFEEIISKQCEQIKFKYGEKSVEFFPIHPDHGVKVQPYACNNLEEYLTKTSETQRGFEYIAPLTYDGSVFQTNHTNKHLGSKSLMFIIMQLVVTRSNRQGKQE